MARPIRIEYQGYFNGSQNRQIQQYREYVEGGRGDKFLNMAPEVNNQIFVGDEEFVEAVQRKG